MHFYSIKIDWSFKGLVYWDRFNHRPLMALDLVGLVRSSDTNRPCRLMMQVYRVPWWHVRSPVFSSGYLQPVGDAQSQGYHLLYTKPYEIYWNPYASVPSASGFRVGFGCLNTFSQGIWSTRENDILHMTWCRIFFHQSTVSHVSQFNFCDKQTWQDWYCLDGFLHTVASPMLGFKVSNMFFLFFAAVKWK